MDLVFRFRLQEALTDLVILGILVLLLCLVLLFVLHVQVILVVLPFLYHPFDLEVLVVLHIRHVPKSYFVMYKFGLIVNIKIMNKIETHSWTCWSR